jgi:tRNA-dihydrouridine synthase B
MLVTPPVPRRPSLPAPLRCGQPYTALAPMQDVTDVAFIHVIARYGPPDWFVTEYFRVHATSTPERHILRSIDENRTGRPIFAQLIGESLPDLERTARALLRHPVAGIDLNLGCPAPKIYRKNVGGGLLRDPARVREIFACLRAAVPGLFTVKMRLGFEDTAHFDTFLELVEVHQVDLLTIHGRTVKQLYRGDVAYERIAHAVRQVCCPVLANGNVTSAPRAASILRETNAAGVMIGRHAIRNPWIFRQVREQLAGEPVFRPTLADVRAYLDALWDAVTSPHVPDPARVSRLKKFLNFVGQSVDPEGRFLHAMRRAVTPAELFAVCDAHLLAEPDALFSLEPFAGVIARPNCEDKAGDSAACSLVTVTG